MELLPRVHHGSIRQHQHSRHPDVRGTVKPRRHVTQSSHTGNSSNSSNSRGNLDSNDEDRIWSQLAFPSYLQSKNKHKPEVCRDFDKAVTAAERRQARDALGQASIDSVDEEEEADWEPETVWHTIRREAERDAAAEPLLSSFLYASILAHDTFERALAFVLSNRLANAVMLPTQLFEIFHEVLISDPDVREGALADVEACRERYPACTSYSQALLYYKGYHAIQTHRIAHALWVRGQKVMAVALQSRMSEVLAVDVHPAARFGRGILLDHGTGVVIGETAVVGNNVSLLQNVTLGGTGKDHGDRHPKISDNVLIGACATVLGNIRVGEGAQIAAGSLVLKPVAPHTMVAGSPAKVVGHVTGNPAEKMQQWSKKLLNWDPFADCAVPTTALQDEQQQQQQQQEQPPPEQQPQQQPPSSSDAATAVGGNGAQAPAASSSSSNSSGRRTALRRPSRASIAAAEARWDAIAAQVSASGGVAAAASSGGSSSSSSNDKASSKGHVNGMAAPSSNGFNRPSMVNGHASSSINSSSHTGASQQQPQQASGQQRHVPGSGPAAAAAAAAAVDVPPVAAAAAAGRKQASADLKGIHEGDVEATLDEDVAAEKWAGKKEEPEYVI